MNVLLNWHFELKKNQKDADYFYIQIWLWKLNLGTFDNPFESQWKSNYFSRFDFVAKICFLSSKLHHWGHTRAVHFSYINGLGSTRALLATPHQNTNRDWRLWFLIRFSYLFILLLFWSRRVSFIKSILQFYYSLDTKVSTNLK